MSELRVESDMSGYTKLLDATPEALLEGVEAGGEVAVEIARSLVRVRSGELRDTIKAEAAELPRGAEVRLSAGEGLDDDRALFNELGTHKMAAQPYLFPAINDPRVFEAVVTELRRRLVGIG